jgi:hypothetical protein
MKKISSYFMFAVMILIAVSALGDEKPWIDVDNCIFCQQITKHEGLWDHMTCEHHEISNGHLMVTVVDPEFRSAYVESQKAMEQIGMDMAAGKIDPTKVYMCGSCEAYGNLLMSGAIVEHIPTKFGDIVLVTSDDPVLMKKIKAYGRRWEEEMAKKENTPSGEE